MVFDSLGLPSCLQLSKGVFVANRLARNDAALHVAEGFDSLASFVNFCVDDIVLVVQFKVEALSFHPLFLVEMRAAIFTVVLFLFLVDFGKGAHNVVFLQIYALFGSSLVLFLSRFYLLELF